MEESKKIENENTKIKEPTKNVLKEHKETTKSFGAGQQLTSEQVDSKEKETGKANQPDDDLPSSTPDAGANSKAEENGGNPEKEDSSSNSNENSETTEDATPPSSSKMAKTEGSTTADSPGSTNQENEGSQQVSNSGGTTDPKPEGENSSNNQQSSEGSEESPSAGSSTQSSEENDPPQADPENGEGETDPKTSPQVSNSGGTTDPKPEGEKSNNQQSSEGSEESPSAGSSTQSSEGNDPPQVDPENGESETSPESTSSMSKTESEDDGSNPTDNSGSSEENGSSPSSKSDIEENDDTEEESTTDETSKEEDSDDQSNVKMFFISPFEKSEEPPSARQILTYPAKGHGWGHTHQFGPSHIWNSDYPYFAYGYSWGCGHHGYGGHGHVKKSKIKKGKGKSNVMCRDYVLVPALGQAPAVMAPTEYENGVARNFVNKDIACDDGDTECAQRQVIGSMAGGSMFGDGMGGLGMGFPGVPGIHTGISGYNEAGGFGDHTGGHHGHGGHGSHGGFGGYGSHFIKSNEHGFSSFWGGRNTIPKSENEKGGEKRFLGGFGGYGENGFHGVRGDDGWAGEYYGLPGENRLPVHEASYGVGSGFPYGFGSAEWWDKTPNYHRFGGPGFGGYNGFGAGTRVGAAFGAGAGAGYGAGVAFGAGAGAAFGAGVDHGVAVDNEVGPIGTAAGYGFPLHDADAPFLGGPIGRVGLGPHAGAGFGRFGLDGGHAITYTPSHGYGGRHVALKSKIKKNSKSSKKSSTQHATARQDIAMPDEQAMMDVTKQRQLIGSLGASTLFADNVGGMGLGHPGVPQMSSGVAGIPGEYGGSGGYSHGWDGEGPGSHPHGYNSYGYNGGDHDDRSELPSPEEGQQTKRTVIYPNSDGQVITGLQGAPTSEYADAQSQAAFANGDHGSMALNGFPGHGSTQYTSVHHHQISHTDEEDEPAGYAPGPVAFGQRFGGYGGYGGFGGFHGAPIVTPHSPYHPRHVHVGVGTPGVKVEVETAKRTDVTAQKMSEIKSIVHDVSNSLAKTNEKLKMLKRKGDKRQITPAFTPVVSEPAGVPSIRYPVPAADRYPLGAGYIWPSANYGHQYGGPYAWSKSHTPKTKDVKKSRKHKASKKGKQRRSVDNEEVKVEKSKKGAKRQFIQRGYTGGIESEGNSEQAQNYLAAMNRSQMPGEPVMQEQEQSMFNSQQGMSPYAMERNMEYLGSKKSDVPKSKKSQTPKKN